MDFEYDGGMVDFVIYTPVLYPTNTPDIYYCYAMAVKLVELQNIVNSDLEDDEWTSIENYEITWDFFEHFKEEACDDESLLCDWFNPCSVEKVWIRGC